MQSRRHSIEETIVSTIIGLAVSTIINMTILPQVVGVHVSMDKNLFLVGVFTLASLLRGYFVRRYYNGRKQK